MSSVLITDTEHSEIVRIQDSLFVASLSFTALSKINIMERRRFQMQSELNEDAIWLTPRNGCQGQGIIWEFPEIEVPDAAAPGPHEDLIVHARVICAPDMNKTPRVGSQVEPELTCKRLRRFVHNWRLDDMGEFLSDKKTMRDCSSDYPGMLAYEESWRIRLTDPWYPRVNAPTIAVAGDTITLTNDAANPNANMFYTLDDSEPGSLDGGNPQSIPYTIPITVPDGCTIIRWAAYQDGYLPSAWGRATINNQ